MSNIEEYKKKVIQEFDRKSESDFIDAFDLGCIIRDDSRLTSAKSGVWYKNLIAYWKNKMIERDELIDKINTGKIIVQKFSNLSNK